MLHLLLGRDWTANRKEILKRIGRDVRERNGNRILMVPELISHEMERQLCLTAGDTSSRYAEVLSFTRLARRVSDSMGSAAVECLDNGGRVVAMAAAARQLSSQLKAYAALETKPEFLSGLIDAIDEFKRCCITAQDLSAAAKETDGSLAQKLDELSLLMEGYDSLCSRGKRDPRDQMTWLLEQLEVCTYGEDHIFYIDGFPDFTRQNLAILEHLIKVSPHVTVSMNCDQIDSPFLAFEKAGSTARELYQCAQRAGIEVTIEWIPEHDIPLKLVRSKLYQGMITAASARDVLTVYRCESPYQECLSAATTVRELVQSGCRYRDITLVCTDMAVYQPLIDFIFQRFHIPVYRSGTEDILQKSVIVTVLSALDAALGGLEQKMVFRYLRSALSPLNPDTCDLVENYAVLWGIRGKKWEQEWKNHPEGLGGDWNDSVAEHLNLLNEARSRAILPLSHLKQGFRNATNLCDQVIALYNFLEEIQLNHRLSQLSLELEDSGKNRDAQVINQLWEILITALEQMYDVLGQTVWEAEHFVRLFRLLLSQYDVGTIPPVLDAVQMGPVSAMRCHHEKHLILLGCEEGKLPGYTGSTGVLTDQERVTLREMGVPLTGGAMEGIQAEFGEIYGVFCGAMDTIRVYSSGDQPSFVYRRLAQLAGEEEVPSNSLGMAQADEMEAAAYLTRWNAEELSEVLNIRDAYRDIKMRQEYSLGKVEKSTIRRLYGSRLTLSASQIDRQAECRMSYFLKYGLRAKERKEITVDPAEFGTYVHAVLENTVRCIQESGGFQTVSLEETLELAHRFSEEYASERFSDIESERMTYLFRRNIQELDMVVQELWLEMKDSLFMPVGFEVNFGKTDALPPINIPNNQIPAVLQGYIDRIDTWTRAGSSYYRVVDYKTGRKDFVYCDIFNGVGLQMLLYLFALKNNRCELLGSHPVAAGVQYFPARAPYISADGKLNEEEAQKERKTQWKRQGLLLKDEEVLQAMEPGEKPKRLCYTVKSDGSLSGDLADRDQMKLLEGYVFRTLAGLVEEIASGNVDPNPYTRKSAHDACAYCPYGIICHKDSVSGRRNHKAINAQQFWESVEKEMNHNGR